MTRLAPYQDSIGLCKICQCPEYASQSRWKSTQDIEYPVRAANNDKNEERCSRCGRLLLNHENVDHPYRGPKT